MLSNVVVPLGLVLSMVALSACDNDLSPAAPPAVAGQPVVAGASASFPEIGLSLTIPEGWTGTLSTQTEGLFVLETAASDAQIFVTAEQATLEQIRAELAQPIPLSETVALQPTGTPQATSDGVSASYGAGGQGGSVEAFARARVGGNGFAMLALALARPDDMPAVRSAADALVEGAVFGAPQQPAAPADPGSSSWAADLAGKKITRFYTTTGYTEKETIWLCADGRMARNFHVGGSDAAAEWSFADASDQSGTWTASADGSLVLTYADGSTSTYALSYDEEGGLYLDGDRFYREEANCQ